mgnify:CR=1 FL=1
MNLDDNQNVINLMNEEIKHKMYEIMTSWGFTTVVEALGLRNAHCTYIYTPSNDSYWSDPFAVLGIH